MNHGIFGKPVVTPRIDNISNYEPPQHEIYIPIVG